MARYFTVCAGLVMALLAGTARDALGQESFSALQEQVRAREAAFAKTMADRDLAGFESFLSPEAVFVGAGGVLRGPKEIAGVWKKFYEGPRAPFSWTPGYVEVLESRGLALSSGPVLDPDGTRVGTFNSVWRREADGVWRVVFDNGCP